MQKKKISILFIIISLLLIISCISINTQTVSYAKERIVTEINTAPIALEDTGSTEVLESEMTEEQSEESLVVEDSNTYTQKELIIIILTSVIIVICLLNLIVTKFGTISLKESLSTSKRLIYYSIFLVGLSTSFAIYNIVTTDNKVLNGEDTKSRDAKSIAVIEITQDEKVSSLKEESKVEDTSVIQVSNNATYTASNLELLKSSGSTTDKDSSLYYGLNSALIIKDGSTIELSNSTIVTGVEYATALFATSLNTNVTLDNVRLTTTKDNSSGIASIDYATVTANDIEILTKGDNSPGINTMNNDSEITIENSTVNTEGLNSPLIYNKGKVTATNLKGTATNSSLITMNSINNIVITDSELTTKLQLDEENIAAINLFTETSKYDRMNYSNASLTIEDSSLTISSSSPIYKEAPLFNITNIEANINISNTDISYGSNILFKITGNDKYGEQKENGGSVIFTATDLKLKGNIIVDEISSIDINLNNTYYKGQVNGDNASKDVDIILDKTTEWELTGNSYIKTLTIQNGKISRIKSQIKSNGYNIYYNAYQNDWLEGKTIKLPGGGKLIPVYES